MAINWQKLEFDIKNYLEEGKKDNTGKNYNIKKTAKMIESLYITEIKMNATDMFFNGILSITVNESSGLHKSLENGFNSGFKTNNLNVLNQTGISGVLQHWSGGQMSPLIPALPIMTVGVNNSIVFPGNVISMNLNGYSDKHDMFSKEIVMALKRHANTVQGLFTGFNSNGNPVAVPWSGIF